MAHEIDYVITELTVEILTNNNIGRASFIFIDLAPHFPKANNMLDKIDEKDDAFIKDYSISSTEITESTDLTGLEFVKH
tara:strand:- start:909 stop:1145 length:237 start_codon:yes stop_codon:yes gene_type:complete